MLRGSNFGPSPLTSTIKRSPITGKPFLERVTYGRNGLHYAAVSCKITQSSVELTCETSPGVGSTLKWVVAVEEQASDPFEWGGYAKPTILSMVPLVGPTQGGVVVVLTGRGFGLMDPSSRLTIHFGAAEVQVFGGSTAVASNGNGNGGLSGVEEVASFTLPEHYGKDIAIFAEVITPAGESLSSNPVLFSYHPPQIDLLTTKWADPAKGILAVVVTGSNFCQGLNGCGLAYLNGRRATTVASWSHSTVEIHTALDEGDVMLEVGGQQSNTWSFAHLSPAIHEDTVKALAKRRFDTPGGDDVALLGYVGCGRWEGKRKDDTNMMY